MTNDLKEKIARAIAYTVHPARATAPDYWENWIIETDKDGFRREAQAVLTAIEESGYVVVPKEQAHAAAVMTALHSVPAEISRTHEFRSYADLSDSATTFNPEEQFEKDNGL